MRPTLSMQVSGDIAEMFNKEKSDAEKKLGISHLTWTQFFIYRERMKRGGARG